MPLPPLAAKLQDSLLGGLCPNGEQYTKAIDRFAAQQNIPRVQFRKGQDKEELARPYLQAAARAGQDRVVLIGTAQERASVWRSWPRKGQEKAVHPHVDWGRQMAYPNHFYFYLCDAQWGATFLQEWVSRTRER